MSGWNLYRTPLVVVLAASTFLTGCVTAQRYSQVEFSDGAVDECHIYRQPLISAKEKVERNTAVAATVGGLLAIALANKSGLSTGETLAAGAAAALAGGFFANQASQGSMTEEKQKLLAELRGQAGAASQAPGTIARMADCRRNQMAQVKGSVGAGLLSAAVARTKLVQIQKESRKDNKLVSEFVQGARQEVDEYVRLAAKENISEEQLLGKYNDPGLPWLRQSGSPSIAGRVAYTVAAEGARVRANASADSAILGSVSRGDTVQVTPDEDRGSWQKIMFRGRPAYIHGSLLADARQTMEAEGDNEQQVAVRNLSRSTLEAEAQQMKLQAVDSEIDGLLSALKA